MRNGVSITTNIDNTVSFIDKNNSLTNLDGLSALIAVGMGEYSGYLSITGNNSLANIEGLSALTTVGEYIDFYGNIAIPDCEVCDLLDQITSGPSYIDVENNLNDSCTPVPGSCP